MKYDYRCDKCKTEEIRSVKMTERENQYCKCGQKLKQIFKKTAMIVTKDGGKY